MKLTLVGDTTEHPLQKIGSVAGVCWSANTADIQKNVNRAISCIESDHGRVLEWVNVEILIEGMSARCMREVGRHCVGTSYLQSSTRYVDESNFKYYTPPSCQKDGVREVYEKGMKQVAEFYGELIELGVPREDAANALPLGMDSKVVWKINLRSLVNFMNKRLCSRALLEIRQFANELRSMLMGRNVEWMWICENLFVPSCERYKFLNKKMCFCIEKKGCGRHKYIKDFTLD